MIENAKRRVLFVDDEVRVLDGLRRMLHKQRDRWEMFFAPGGEEALKALSEAPFDVVVSDMRMPGIDGAQLLTMVKEKHPRAVRIVLSGHTELDLIMSTVTVAHQYLTKPCESDVVLETIERACEYQAMLGSDAARTLVGELGALPSAPATYVALNRALTDPDVSITAVAKVVEQDVAMCAKILQLVNSSFFGRARQLTTIASAIPYLGFNTLRSLALSAHVFNAFRSAPGLEAFSVDYLRAHSIQVANLARKMFGEKAKSEDAFMAGMLHDVGKLVLASRLPQRFATVLAALAEDETLAEHDVERQLLAVSHAEVGAYLLGIWGLPLPIVQAVAYHHDPNRAGPKAFGACGAVHVANSLVLQVSPPPPGSGAVPAIDEAYLEAASVRGSLDEWREIASSAKG